MEVVALLLEKGADVNSCENKVWILKTFLGLVH